MTVKWLPPRTIAISKLKMAGDFKSRLAADRVQDRARSIEKWGLLHRPIVHYPQMKVLCGNDRIAALVQLGEVAVECELVECTDKEAKQLEFAENYQRRHNAEEQANMLKSVVEDYVSDEDKDPVDKEAMAKLLGKLPSSIDRQERRSNAKVRRETIRTFGLAVDDDWYKETQKCLRLLLSVEKKLRAASSVIGRLKEPYPKGRIGRLKVAVREVHAEIKAAVPSMLCPHCKNVEEIAKVCVGCQGSGFITKGQEKGVPKALMNGKEPLVQYRGETMPLVEFIQEYGIGETEVVEDDLGDLF